MTEEQRQLSRRIDETRGFDNPDGCEGHDLDGHQKRDHENEITIMVNSRERTVTKLELSSDDLVKLAFKSPPSGDSADFMITYCHSKGNNINKVLKLGATVKVNKDMIFNVTSVDKS